MSQNAVGDKGKRTPYSEAVEGVRRDLVRLLANLSHKNEVVQNEICRLEVRMRPSLKLIWQGMPLLLSCCAVDDVNPFMRGAQSADQPIIHLR